jgi:putative lipoprotein
MTMQPTSLEGTTMHLTIPSAAKWWLSVFAAGILLSCSQGGGATRIAGTVTYREKVALPDKAAVNVRLEDAAAAAGAAPLAQQTIELEGQQVPIPFALDVDRSALQAKHRYIVRATIRAAGGEVLFTTPPDQKPLENPNTSGRLEIVLVRPN